MDVNSWEMAFRVCIWGFGTVFFILVVLMGSVKLMSAIIRGFREPK